MGAMRGRPGIRAALVCLAVCSSVHTLGAQSARARVWPPGFQTQIALDTVGLPVLIEAPVGKTYRAVIEAFEALKIPVDVKDSIKGVVGNSKIVQAHSMAGSQMSRWFNCGTGMTGPNADTFRLYIAVAALLDKVTADTTRLVIGMVAGSQDMGGNSKEPVPCATSGNLEQKLVELIQARVKKP
jgi:hypothetical protein